MYIDSITFLTPCSPTSYPPWIFPCYFQYQSLMVGRLNFPQVTYSDQMIRQRLVSGVTGTRLCSHFITKLYGFTCSAYPNLSDSRFPVTHVCGWWPINRWEGLQKKVNDGVIASEVPKIYKYEGGSATVELIEHAWYLCKK